MKNFKIKGYSRVFKYIGVFIQNGITNFRTTSHRGEPDTNIEFTTEPVWETLRLESPEFLLIENLLPEDADIDTRGIIFMVSVPPSVAEILKTALVSRTKKAKEPLTIEELSEGAEQKKSIDRKTLEIKVSELLSEKTPEDVAYVLALIVAKMFK